MAFGLSEDVMYPIHFMQQTFFRVLLTEQPKKNSPHYLNISKLLFPLLFPCLSLSRLPIPLSLVMSRNVHPNCATSFLALCASAIWSGKGQYNSVAAANEYISSLPSSPPLQNSTSFTTDTPKVVLLTSSRLALKFSCLPIFCGLQHLHLRCGPQFSLPLFSNASLLLTVANYFARLLFLISL